MKDPAIAIKDRLVAQGVGTFAGSSGWGIYIGSFPSSPDTVVLVNATGGRAPFPHLLYNEPTVQVSVRGKKGGYVAARDKMNQVVAQLLGMNSVTLQGDVYRSCNQIGDVSWLGEDDSTRPLFVANFWFIVLPAAEAGENRVPIS